MRFPALAICGGMVLGAWGVSLAPGRSGALAATSPVVGRETGILSQLDAIDARVAQLVRVREACSVLIDVTDRAARQRPGYERRRAARAVLAAHVAAREARDAAEGWVCKP